MSTNVPPAAASSNSTTTTTAARVAGRLSGWLKAVIGTFAGLVSGALVMYASPLLDKVVRPARPMANFGVEADGLAVTFHNRSQGASGWWDFGDGSPLEPVVPDEQVVSHVYASPGDYSVKLTMRNYLGEEHERQVVVRLQTDQGDPPLIASLDAIPLSPGSFAPATFRVLSRVKNANVCVWDLDEDRPLEVTTDPSGTLDRLVTFQRAGGYVIKLAAVNGGRSAQRSEIVSVLEPPAGAITAILSVSADATQVEKRSKKHTFAQSFPPESKDGVFRIDRQVPAEAGYQITGVSLQTAAGQGQGGPGQPTLSVDPSAAKAPGARNLQLRVADNHRSVRLTGELVRAGGLGRRGAPPSLALPVLLHEERQSSVSLPAVPMSGTLALPGSLVLPLPPVPENWVDVHRQMRLELRDGDRVIWQESQLPRGATVTVRNQRYTLTAVPVGEQVRIDMGATPGGLNPAAN
jgi:hypothetical protein